MIQKWNYDKPHRCPGCHAVWTWTGEYEDMVYPRWWRTYDCYQCGAVFSGRWAWAERWRDKARLKVNYWRHEWRMRRSR